MTPANCSSPLDLMNLAGLAPPSEAIGTILAAAYAQAPTPAESKLWRQLSKMRWPKARPRRVAACIGRRGLKTSGILAWSCVFETLCGGHELHALAGSRIYGVIVAPKLPQAREAVRAVRSVLDSLASIGVRYVERDANGNPELVITEPVAPCERVITVEVCDELSARSRAVFFFGADEAGRWPSEEWLSTRDTDVVQAVRGAMAQFPGALEVYTSNPGKPGSHFHKLVTKPPAGTLVVQAASWVTNPRISRDRCWEDAEGVLSVFEVEYEATRWGAAGGGFLDSGAVWSCIGSPQAGKGPRPGSFLVGFDHGQLKDACGVVAVSVHDVEISPGTSPVRHVVVEHAESIPSSRKDPVPTAALVGRLVAVARSYGNAPIFFDVHSAVDVADALRKLGWRPFDEKRGGSAARLPPRKTYLQCSVAPQAQDPRWRMLEALVSGRRLHLGDDGEPLARELVGLVATMQSGGWLKVEGRGSSPDNLVDALSLTLPFVMKLPPTDGPSGSVKCETSVSFEHGAGLDVRNLWYRETPDGNRAPAEVPRWHPSFEDYARDMIAQGTRTRAIEAWEREQEEAATKKKRSPGISSVLPF